ncbi:uncharacterized protein LOC106884313 [Octopus bimaculoides]|uniref:Uncharacterized protein n=1 Tax=Octopus bimaculoides TaxID=37653 RepID=A0A0L8I3Z0_OCTBM|nr:uncharacterized protein LOC106884313 [Octopus bimaculoides]|eukprot:XP_014791123.1 PREDICTED: uncharacterized protein LOC106884313 [Octopus bimaculoides]
MVVTELKGRILVYSINGCVHCIQAKRLLEKFQLPHITVNVDIHTQCKDWMLANLKKKSVPQIFFNDVHIGNYNDLKALMSDDNRLAELIELVKNNPLSEAALKIPCPETDLDNFFSCEINCETDEYVDLVNDLKKSGIIAYRWSGLCKFKKLFSEKDFVDWVTKTKNTDYQEAVRLCKALLSHHFCREVSNAGWLNRDDTYYMLLEDLSSSALNAKPISFCKPTTLDKLGKRLRFQISAIYDSYLSANGKVVDYKSIEDSNEFKQYEKLTLQLQRVQFGYESDDQKLAFFINIYNALVIHGIIRFGPPTNIVTRYNFFNKTRYMIGGYSYSLREIENGVLRANETGIGMITKPFQKTDPRLRVAMPEVNPYIHFALVCGASGCPPISIYSAEEVHVQLQQAAELFLESDENLVVDAEKKQVKLSLIFKWYRKDFHNTDKGLLEWIFCVLKKGEKKSNLRKVIDEGKVTIVYLPYNWSLNS